MILCPLIALAVLGIAYFKIHRRSSKLETGLPGALGYGLFVAVSDFFFSGNVSFSTCV